MHIQRLQDLAAMVCKQLGTGKKALGGAMTTKKAALRALMDYRRLRSIAGMLRLQLEETPRKTRKWNTLNRKLLSVTQKMETIECAVEELEGEERELLTMEFITAPIARQQIISRLSVSESTFYRVRRAAIRHYLRNFGV